MDMQKLLDSVMAGHRQARSSYHVTLGEMIEAANRASPSGFVGYVGGGSPGEEHSYRGYYSDLSFSDVDELVVVSEWLNVLESALGREYEGYKGGEFIMSEDTPLWRAPYGCTGEAIVSVEVYDGALILASKNVD